MLTATCLCFVLAGFFCIIGLMFDTEYDPPEITSEHRKRAAVISDVCTSLAVLFFLALLILLTIQVVQHINK